MYNEFEQKTIQNEITLYDKFIIKQKDNDWKGCQLQTIQQNAV